MALRRLPALVIATAALLAPATAASAAPYAPPTWPASPGGLPGAGLFATLVSAAMTPAGNAGAVVANPAGAATPSQLLRFNDGDFVFASEGLGLTDAHLAVAQRDHLVIAGSSAGAPAAAHLRVAEALAAGGRITITPVPGSTGLRVASAAADAAGDVALLGASATKRVVYLRAAGRRGFHAVLTIRVTEAAGAAAVALGAQGDVLLAWEDRGAISARYRGARSWEPPHVLGAGAQSELQALIDPAGRAIVAWMSHATPAVLSLATAAPGRRWGARRQVESVARAVPAPGVLLRASGAHRALLTWTGANATTSVVKAMAIADGRPGGVQALSRPAVDAGLDDAAAVPGDGPAIVLWHEAADPAGGTTTPRLLASTRTSGARSFGAPEQVAPVPDGVLVAPTVLLSAANHLATVLFGTTTGLRTALRQPIEP